jgi:hypothetical protein
MDQLTAREHEVAALAATGLQTKESPTGSELHTARSRCLDGASRLRCLD